jgi:hypothetical protein
MAPEIIQEVGHDYKVLTLTTYFLAKLILIDPQIHRPTFGAWALPRLKWQNQSRLIGTFIRCV